MSVICCVKLSNLFLIEFMFRWARTNLLKLQLRLDFKLLSHMPILPIPVGDYHFGSFNLSPARFLKSCRNSRFFRYTHQDIQNGIWLVEILYLNLQMSYYFQIFCSISIPPRRHRVLFSFKSSFSILNK